MLTIGCDPELQVLKPDKDPNLYTPAWEITKGTKKEPVWPVDIPTRPIKDMGLKIQADGVALEFNINPIPITNLQEGAEKFSRTIANSIDLLRMSLGCSFGFEPCSSNYAPEVFLHPLALVRGCDPDYSAYSANPDFPRIFNSDLLYRDTKFFGGHVHVGYDLELCPPHVFAKFMDLFWYSLLKEGGQGDRRASYGEPGIFRPKSYGIEYRTPSPFWLRDGSYCRTLVESVFNIEFFLKNARDDMVSIFQHTNWDALKNNFMLEDFERHYAAGVIARRTIVEKSGLAWQTIDSGIPSAMLRARRPAVAPDEPPELEDEFIDNDDDDENQQLAEEN